MSIFQQLLNMKNSTDESLITTKEKLSTHDFLLLVGKIQHILEKNDIQPGNKVIIIMTPSMETVATIMAVGFIGATYIPIDISMPKSRIDYIIKDTKAKVVLTNQKYLLLPNSYDIRKLLIKDIEYNDAPIPMLRKRHMESTAYIIYTSGSTGNPKGVEVSFSNLDFFINTFNCTFISNKNSVFLLNTALQFDVSIAELYGWIANNASLFILDEKEIKDIKKLPLIIKEHNITHLSIAPSIMNAYSNNEIKYLSEAKLEYVLIAGEEFPISLAKKLRGLVLDSKVYNCYGPTEATVYATYHRLSIEDLNNKKIPIGKSFDNIATLLIQANNSSHHELYLSGDGIAKGYINLQNKTDESFPYIDGKRYYKTGDLVFLDKDTGDFTFIGRKDFQLEINSIRVEPGEIENAIATVLNTDKCIVFKWNKKLVCFYLKNENIKNVASTKNKLLEILPSYMIPSIWEPLESFPINISGKIDRIKLIEIYSTKNITNSDTQNKLLNNIRRISDIPNLGLYDNLFDSGLDSLSVIEIEIYLETEFSKTLSPGYIYLHPTVFDIQNDMGKNKELDLNTYQKIQKILNGNQINFKLIKNKNNHLKLEINESNLTTLKMVNTYHEIFSKIQSAVFEKNGTSIFHEETNYSSIIKLFEKNKSDSYESSIFQKVYFNIKLNSFTEVDFEYPDNICADETKKLIKYLVNNIEAFRTTISKNSNHKLYSNVYNYSEIETRIKDLTELSQSQREKIIEQDKIDTKNLIMDNLLGNPLYRILAHRTSFNKIKLSIILHHSVSDGASSAILSKYVSSYFQKSDIESLGMKVYLDKLSTNSKAPQLLKDNYIKKLENIKNNVSNSGLKTSIWENGFKIIKKVGELDKWKKFLLVADEVTDDYIRKNELTEITFQMLFDFRNVGDYKFDFLVNDCHETVTFYRHKNTNSVNFINNFYDHINYFHYKKGISLGLAIYSNFPTFSEEQQKLQEIVETTPLNIDYIGEFSEKDLNKKIQEMDMLKHQLKNLKKQTRFTAFSSREDVYIFQVSNL